MFARALVNRQPPHPAVTSLVVTLREGAVAGEEDQQGAVLLSEDVSKMSDRMVKTSSPNLKASERRCTNTAVCQCYCMCLNCS